MTKTRFVEFAASVSIHVARDIALANGVTLAVVQLWTAELVK